MLMARSINPSAPSFFRAKLSPHAKVNRVKAAAKAKAAGGVASNGCKSRLLLLPLASIIGFGRGDGPEECYHDAPSSFPMDD